MYLYYEYYLSKVLLFCMVIIHNQYENLLKLFGKNLLMFWAGDIPIGVLTRSKSMSRKEKLDGQGF